MAVVVLLTAGGGESNLIKVRYNTAVLYLQIFFLSELKNVSFDNFLEQLSRCFFI
jgi:hypothetical protein